MLYKEKLMEWQNSRKAYKKQILGTRFIWYPNHHHRLLRDPPSAKLIFPHALDIGPAYTGSLIWRKNWDSTKVKAFIHRPLNCSIFTTY